jgi:hypothetical protein
MIIQLDFTSVLERDKKEGYLTRPSNPVQNFEAGLWTGTGTDHWAGYLYRG